MGVGNCSDKAISDFSKHVDGQLMRVNTLLVASTIVIGVMVGIGAYGQRYRHHPLTNFLFLGATTLFLPILSYVVSTIGNQDGVAVLSEDIILGRCSTRQHIVYVFMWASLVQIAGVNPTAKVADDHNKGRNITPPVTVLLVQAIWTSYLAVNFIGREYYTMGQWSLKNMELSNVLLLLPLFALLVAKLLVKYYAWYGARGSLAFGRNLHFIVGYMEHIKAHLASERSLPPLIVTGEDTTLVQKEPHGYRIKWSSNQADGTRIDNNNLVSTDKVWRLEDDIFPRSCMYLNGECAIQASSDFSSHIDGQLVRVNALLVASTIVIGVMVGMGYGQRYRHHPLAGFLFLGASTLFLPILSYVVSTIGNQNPVAVYSDPYTVTGWCDTGDHISLVFIWAGLVQLAAVNTTAIVAGDDNKKGRNTPPATVLLVQAIWTSYLVVDFIGKDYDYSSKHWSLTNGVSKSKLLLLPPFALLVAKLLVKYYAWYGAKESLAFGRNPHLIVGYMEQVKDESQNAEHSLPPLIVTGEDTTLVQKEPHGYGLKWLSSQADATRIDNNVLMTIDKVWRLADDLFLRYSTKQLKDVCFSFALFKLLRCRFARHTIAEAGFIKNHNLLPDVLLEDGDDERAFGVIAHELSFLHGYYYSSLPTSYSRSWLPILSISISLLSMGWSLFYIWFLYVHIYYWGYSGQMTCHMDCDQQNEKQYGNIYFDLAPVLLLAVLVVLAEVREIAFYICSDWTKVAMICHYVRHASSWQQSPWKKKLFGCLLCCQCRMLNHWVDKMNQCSVLALNLRTTPVALLRHLIPLLDRKKVPRAVKTAVLKPLRIPSWKNRSNGVASLCTRLQLEADHNPLSLSNGVKGIADTMLVAHIATSILEVRRPEFSRQPDSSHKIAATHLSRYCAYLVAYVPDLLPDDDQWCKSLYKAVQKEGKQALAVAGGTKATASNPEALVQALNAGPEVAHYVLKNGAELGKKLVELVGNEGEEAAWEVLANFWSEMILYAAPSDNVDAHAEAIARGGELITQLWTLLIHLGVVSRPEAATPNALGDV